MTGGKACVVHDTSVPREGSSTSAIEWLLQRGQCDCDGNVAAPHSSHRLPRSRGWSEGHVNTSAMGFWVIGSGVYASPEPRFNRLEYACASPALAEPSATIVTLLDSA